MRLVKVPAKPTAPGCVSRPTYRTADGRFEIHPYWSVGGGGWQAVATDGTEPFTSGRRRSRYFNGETLRDCREEIASLYETEEEQA